MQKVLRTVALGAAVPGVISWISLATIETNALSHPDFPTESYSQPLKVKGVVRYVTSDQKHIDLVANIAFFLSILTGLASVIGANSLSRL